MNIYWAAGLGFITCLIVTPLVINFARKFAVMDFPDRPHPAILHKEPTPRGGGLAILISIVSTYLFFSLMEPSLITKHVIGVFLGAGIVVLVGVLDDKYDLNPYFRLASNFLAVAVVVAFGVGITFVANPFNGAIRFDEIIVRFSFPEGGFFGGPHSIVLFADIFAFLWIAWLMNALNWSSGVDCHLSGVTVIATLVLGFVAIKYLQ